MCHSSPLKNDTDTKHQAAASPCPPHPSNLTMSVPKPPPVVIDLCNSSSSDEEEGKGPPRVALSQGVVDNGVRHKRKNAGRSAASGTNERNRKTPRNEAASQHPNDEVETNVLVYLSTEGGENAVATDGILPALQTAKQKDLQRRLFVIEPSPNKSLTHIGQKDRWSCGYRNLQMFLAAFVPTLRPDHLYVGLHSSYIAKGSDRVQSFRIPSLSYLEEELEVGWCEGFDEKGRDHYGGNVKGRHKWIGAVEVWSILACAGIDACLVQFIRCPESRKLLGPFCLAYFADKNPWCNANPMAKSREICVRLLETAAITVPAVTTTEKKTVTGNHFPLYLQWSGHSVSIVGVELSATGAPLNLIVMDPAKSGSKLRDSLQKGDIAPARMPLSMLLTKDCQIILASRRMTSDYDQEEWKEDINCLTAAPRAVHAVETAVQQR